MGYVPEIFCSMLVCSRRSLTIVRDDIFVFNPALAIAVDTGRWLMPGQYERKARPIGKRPNYYVYPLSYRTRLTICTISLTFTKN